VSVWIFIQVEFQLQTIIEENIINMLLRLNMMPKQILMYSLKSCLLKNQTQIYQPQMQSNKIRITTILKIYLT